MVPGVLFEELGYTYIGPVDGHDLSMLINILKQVKQINGPALVHVVTQKARDIPIQNLTLLSIMGFPPFDINNGKKQKKKDCSFSKA